MLDRDATRNEINFASDLLLGARALNNFSRHTLSSEEETRFKNRVASRANEAREAVSKQRALFQAQLAPFRVDATSDVVVSYRNAVAYEWRERVSALSQPRHAWESAARAELAKFARTEGALLTSSAKREVAQIDRATAAAQMRSAALDERLRSLHAVRFKKEQEREKFEGIFRARWRKAATEVNVHTPQPGADSQPRTTRTFIAANRPSSTVGAHLTSRVEEAFFNVACHTFRDDYAPLHRCEREIARLRSRVAQLQRNRRQAAERAVRSEASPIRRNVERRGRGGGGEAYSPPLLRPQPQQQRSLPPPPVKPIRTDIPPPPPPRFHSTKKATTQDDLIRLAAAEYFDSSLGALTRE